MRCALAAAGALLAMGSTLPGCGAVQDDDAPVAAVAPAVEEPPPAEATPAVAYAVAPAADATPAAAPLVDRAREIIRSSCGTCHTASSPQANPKALAIYDLDHADWGATMSRTQLESFRKRVAGKAEWAGEPRATLDAYVEELLARSAP